MKNNILITWTSRWLGRFLAEKLSEENNVIWISRKKLDQKKFLDLNFDLTDFSKFDEIIEKILNNNFKCLNLIFLRISKLRKLWRNNKFKFIVTDFIFTKNPSISRRKSKYYFYLKYYFKKIYEGSFSLSSFKILTSWICMMT